MMRFQMRTNKAALANADCAHMQNIHRALVSTWAAAAIPQQRRRERAAEIDCAALVHLRY